MLKLEDDGDMRFDFDGLAVQDQWTIAPLEYRVVAVSNEQRVATDDFERANGAVGGDDGAKFDAALAVRHLGKDWISGFNAADEHGGVHVGHLDDARRSFNGFRR